MDKYESSKEKIERLCPEKYKGHRCVIDRKDQHTKHVCFCDLQWEIDNE